MKMKALLHFNFPNSQHPNIKFTMEKETDRILSFLDVCIDNDDPSCLKTSVYRKRLLLDCLLFSLASFLSLIRLGSSVP